MSPAAVFTIEDADRLVLEAADTLFYERGISGVSIAEIRDASGVSLRRIYGLYPSKRDLVLAWLNDRHIRWMTWFTETVERHIARGTDPVLASFDALREWTRSPGYRGCAFINAIAEPTEIDDAHRAIVAEHKLALVRHLATLSTRTRSRTPAWFADALVVLIDGAIVQSTVFGNNKPITAARKAAAHLLETLP
jgi:AcrR family transcriptional regulator